MLQITVDLSKVAPLLAKLAPEEQARRSRSAMQESLAYLKTEVLQATPVDTGLGRGSVFTSITGASVSLTGKVASPLMHMVVLEEGRRPGATPPPLAPIRAWLSRHGMDAGLAFVVARAIGRRGMKPHHMFRKATEKGAPVVKRIFERHITAGL